MFEFLLTFLRQFAGGPGTPENNLVRFILPAILWGVLFYIAWKRRNSEQRARERWLMWGFGLGFVREIIMFGLTVVRVLDLPDTASHSWIIHPLEHGLAMAAIIVIAAAYLRFALDETRLSTRYLAAGMFATLVCLISASLIWKNLFGGEPGDSFHQTPAAWFFHLPLSLFILGAIILLSRSWTWLSKVIIVALLLFLVSEVLILVNNVTGAVNASMLCPIGNTFHILAVPVFAYVYLQEQAIEKKNAETALAEYRDSLEGLVYERTADLHAANQRLTLEIAEREQAEYALEKLSRRSQTILQVAGEGICGIDRSGRCVFANPAAATMMDVSVEEMLSEPEIFNWYHAPQENCDSGELCPICAAIQQGHACHGDDLYFWRQDGSSYPVRYACSPTYEEGQLTGTVMIFQDITERKKSEVAIAQRSARLAAQNAVAATLSRSLDLETLLDDALETVLNVLNQDVGVIFLWDHDCQSLEPQAVHGSASECDILESILNQCICAEISHQAMASQKGIVAAYDEIPAEQRSCMIDRRGVRSVVSVPLVSKGQALGALTLGTRQASGFDQPEIDLLTGIGQQIGMAVENARLYHEAERWASELSALNRASLALTSTFDSSSIEEQITSQASRLMTCDGACLLRYAQEQESFKVLTSTGLSVQEQDLLVRGSRATALFSEMLGKGELQIVPAVPEDTRVPAAWYVALGVQSLIGLPIWGPQDPEALLLLMDRQRIRYWRRDEIDLITSYASSAAVALQNAQLTEQLGWAAALEERHRIATNMHDGLAQTLSLLGLKVDQAIDYVANDQDVRASEILLRIRQTVNQATTEVRRSITSLRESPRPRLSLQKQLAEIVAGQRKPDQVVLQLVSVPPKDIFLSSEQEAHVIPLLKEAIINAIKHAQAAHIWIALSMEGSTLHLTIKDDGLGFDPRVTPDEADNHFGLSIMRARASVIAGTLHIDSKPGEGCSVTLAWQPGQEPGYKHISPQRNDPRDLALPAIGIT